MPLYSYKCNKHGSVDVFQGMNDKHEAVCPTCSLKMKRIFVPLSIKCGNATLGNTRDTLFDNLASEGFANKEWREHDSYYQRAKGIESQ